MDSFRVTAVSLCSQPASPRENLEHHTAWIERAKAENPDLICFPELGLTGYSITGAIWEESEPVPGPSTQALVELAREHDVMLAAGIAENDRDIVYNTYVIVGPEGYIGKSRKIHIPPAEVGYWRGGGIPPVIDIGVAKVGVNICFDNWLPESSRMVALQGAEVILAPYVWAVGDWDEPPDHASRNRAWKDYAGRTFPARAIDNGVFLIAINACGPSPYSSTPSFGNPMVMIYSTLGQLVAASPDDASDEVMVTADLDRGLLAERRSQGVFHPRFRRPELYGILAEGDIGPQDPR
ncbi:MAG: carbon-nitrogen hydrolase family protein [Chloroflexi bacterium]|nr:carbon-nitrogen hydrolase family protein [Chloroflexota bacterium]